MPSAACVCAHKKCTDHAKTLGNLFREYTNSWHNFKVWDVFVNCPVLFNVSLKHTQGLKNVNTAKQCNIKTILHHAFTVRKHQTHMVHILSVITPIYVFAFKLELAYCGTAF